MRRSPRVLCEFCGYDLSGLDEHSACGECGKPVSLSLPSRRLGSPFQNSRMQALLLVAAWLRTDLAMLRKPKGMWEIVQIESRRSLWLLVSNASVGAVLAWAVVSWGWPGGARAAPWAPVVGVSILATGVGVLSAIEYAGLRTFGRRNGWRVSPGVATAVVGHASVGWVVGLVLGAIGWTVGSRGDSGPVVPGALRPLLGDALGPGWLPAIAGFGIGLMIFESLVYVGVRRCRFANPASARL